MANSRTKNVTMIAITSALRQMLNLFAQFISRTVFIYVLGAEYLGLNGLFSNILSLLSLAELGIGSAMSFYLYKPIVDNDYKRIKSLLSFYKICYRVIGLTMIIIGLLICPFLPSLVNFEQNISINLYVVYILFLINTAVSYLVYAYKQALPAANQEQYKIEGINIFYIVINCVADAVILICFKEYILYLVCKIILSILRNITIAKKIDKEYPYIKENDSEGVGKEEIKHFFLDLKDIALFKVGSTLYNSTDNIIISKMLGTVIVGYYSNYFMIITAVTSIISVVVKSFTAGIGNLVVKEKRKDVQYNYFLQIDFLAYCLVAVSTILLFQILNSFIMIWVGEINTDYILSQEVILFLCINFYIDGTTQIINIFRESSGFFSIGRNYQIAGGLINIVLSIILGYYFELAGIFAATVISKLFVSLFPFMIIVSKKVFGMRPLTIIKRYSTFFCITIIIGGINWCANRKFHMTNIRGMIMEIIITFGVSVSLILIACCKRYEFKQNVIRAGKIIKKVKEK